MSDPPALAFQAPAPEALAPLFPHFEILNLIACGGMGAVYRARQASLDRIVAIKILPPELGTDREYALKFQSEARLMANLSNPHIVTVFDFGLAGNYLYIVMEYVDGRTLHDMLKAGHLKQDTVLKAMTEVCRGLDYAHEKGLVHLDIKPGNIMINQEGEARVLDFGLAKLLDPRKGSAEETMGTPDYAAPERLNTGAKVDHRADIYSLGIMFYELLTGNIPRGNCSPASKVAGVDPAVDTIIHKCSRTDPALRYQRAQEIVVALIKLRRGAAKKKQILASTAASKATTTGNSGSEAVSAYQQMMAGKGSKGWVAWVLSGVSLAAIIAVLAMFGAFGGKEDETGEKRSSMISNKEEVGGRKGNKPRNDPRRERPDKNTRPNRGNPQGPKRPIENPDPTPSDPPEPVDPPEPPKQPKPFPSKELVKEVDMLKKALADGSPIENLDLKFIKPNGSKAYYVIDQKMSWQEASKTATEVGAHLATLTSSEEEQFVRDIWFGEEIGDRDSYAIWFGANWDNNSWAWVTDEQWEYTAWQSKKTPTNSDNSPLAALFRENYWVDRPQDDKYSALIEWELVAPDATPSHEIDPRLAEVEPEKLTRLEELRSGFTRTYEGEVLNRYNKAIADLGDKYITALEKLIATVTIPERLEQANNELKRFRESRVLPTEPDRWPDLGNIQSVLLTEAKRYTDSAKSERQRIVKIYDDALLVLLSDFSKKFLFDDVELVKAERQRIEELRVSETIGPVEPEISGMRIIAELLERDRLPRYATRFSNGDILVSGGDGLFRLFSTEGEGTLESEWEAGNPLGRCAMVPFSDHFIALKPEGIFEVWNVSSKRRVFQFEDEAGAPVRIKVRPDGMACIVGTMPFFDPKTGGFAGQRPWVFEKGEEFKLDQLEFMKGTASHAAFTPNSKYLAISVKKGLDLRLWGEAEPLWTNTDCTGGAVAFIEGGDKIICGRVIVDTRTGETVTDLRLKEPERFEEDASARNAFVNTMTVIGKEMDHVAFGLVGGSVEIWKLDEMKRIHFERLAHNSHVTSIVMSERGDKLITTGRDGAVRLWDPFASLEDEPAPEEEEENSD